MTDSKKHQLLFSWLKPHLPILFGAFIAMVFLALSTGAYALLLGPTLNLILNPENFSAENPFLKFMFDLAPIEDKSSLYILPGLILFVGTIKAFSYFFQFYLMGKLGQKVVYKAREATFNLLSGWDMEGRNKFGASDLINRNLTDVSLLESLVTYAYSTLIRDTLQVIVLIGVCLYLNFMMTMIMVVFLPAAVLPLYLFGKKIRVSFRSSQNSLSKLSQFFEHIFYGFAEIKLMARDSKIKSDFKRINDEYYKEMLFSFKMRGATTPVMEWIGALIFTVILSVSIFQISKGTIAGDEFLSFFASLIMAYQPIKSLSRINQHLSPGLASLDRICELYDHQVADPKEPAYSDMADQIGAIEKLSLSYDKERAIFKDLSHEFQKKMLWIKGKSGAGKTSLMSILAGLINADEGELKLNSKIFDPKLSYKDQVAYVSQTPYLFSGSIRENLNFACEKPVSDEILEGYLAKMNLLHLGGSAKEILDIEVGSFGVKISGGERQRLAILRAILKGSPALFLDEATSQLDSINEENVLKWLPEIDHLKWVVIISHRDLEFSGQVDEISLGGA